MLNKGNNIFNILIISCALNLSLMAQDEGYSYNMLLRRNPAVAGAAGDGTLRISYVNYYPGNDYNLHSVNLSYDGYFEGIHGGAGLVLSGNNFAGVVNDLLAGLSYSYHFRAGNDLYISAGLSFAMINRTFRTTGLVLADQIDVLGGSLLPSAETLNRRGRTIPDFASGIIISGNKFTAGISADHLAQPDMYPGNQYDGRLRRRYSFFATTGLPLSNDGSFLLRPLLFTGLSSDWYSMEAGMIIEIKNLSVNTLLYTDKSGMTDLKTGFRMNFKGFSSYYTYRFNIIARESVLPLSVSHSSGISISLNFVDKRKTVKTINFPEL